MGKEEQDLVIGVGVARGDRVQASFTNLKDPSFHQWVNDVACSCPNHLKWYSKCWDQTMLFVLSESGSKYILAAHECFGRDVARRTLLKLRDEVSALLPASGDPTPSQTSKLEKKLKALSTAVKGMVPGRKVLILYPGAPKKFLTKEDQAPEFLDAGGKSRLQKELEDLSDDDFVFSVEKGARSVEDEEDEDAFEFNIPSSVQQQQRIQQQRHHVPMIFSSPHVRLGPSQPVAANSPRPASKKIPSPAMSTDFSWNGARVSPEGPGMTAAGPGKPPPKSPMGNALSTLAFRGKAMFSAQFERSGAVAGQAVTMAHDGKVRGQVGDIAPSGLSWEDEIASQLAAAGVRVSAAKEGEADDLKPGRTRAMFGVRGGPPPLAVRSGSTRHQDKLSGLGRIAKGLKKTFHLQPDAQN